MHDFEAPFTLYEGERLPITFLRLSKLVSRILSHGSRAPWVARDAHGVTITPVSLGIDRPGHARRIAVAGTGNRGCLRKGHTARHVGCERAAACLRHDLLLDTGIPVPMRGHPYVPPDPWAEETGESKRARSWKRYRLTRWRTVRNAKSGGRVA